MEKLLQMAFKHMKRGLITLTKEMQIKNTQRNHFTHIKEANCKSWQPTWLLSLWVNRLTHPLAGGRAE